MTLALSLSLICTVLPSNPSPRAEAPQPTESAVPHPLAVVSFDEFAEATEDSDRCVPFKLTQIAELEGVAQPRDFVENLLTEGGASVIYGPSNCGKSFFVLDLAACVATGSLFRGDLNVTPGTVIYVALEGSIGVHNRIQALRSEGLLPDTAPLFLCFEPVSLLEPDHADRLAAAVKQASQASGQPCRLVILDTMARAMGGGDENKAQDMGEAVKSIDAIRSATGAHVSVVHHCGKDEARGARGHSSLRAAVDTEIEVVRREGHSITTARVTKQRDLSIGDPMPFSLLTVKLGTDRRGKPITSCVVQHEDAIMAAKPGKPGRKPLCTPDDMLRYLPMDSTTAWKMKVKEETGLNDSQFYAHKKVLEGRGAIQCDPETKQIIRKPIKVTFSSSPLVTPETPKTTN